MITVEERQRRKKAIDFARGNVRLEGCVLDAEIEWLNAEFIAGRLTSLEHSVACQKHILGSTLPGK